MEMLKVMSFNIRHGKGMDGRIDLERIAGLIKEQDIDLLGLQEVDKNMPRSRLANQMARLAKLTGYNYCYHPNLKILGGGMGNGILSKFPIINSYNQVLTSSKEPRGLIVAVVEKGNRKIKFMSTHLGLVDSERMKQADEILRNINKDEQAVLVGDFNTTADNPEIQKLVRKGLIDVFPSCQEKGKIEADEITKNGSTFAYKSESPNVRIDYIFTTRNIQGLKFRVIESYVSDHFPIVAELKLA